MEKTWKRVCEHAPAGSVARESWEQEKKKATHREREFRKRRQKQRRQKATTRERQNGEKKYTKQNHQQQLCPPFKHVETLRLQIAEIVCLVCVPLSQAHTFWDVPVGGQGTQSSSNRAWMGPGRWQQPLMRMASSGTNVSPQPSGLLKFPPDLLLFLPHLGVGD